VLSDSAYLKAELLWDMFTNATSVAHVIETACLKTLRRRNHFVVSLKAF